MRLTDLLDAEVVDRCGQRAGRVHDVRLVRDGPLIVGRTPSAPAWATNEATVNGPLLVKLLAGWLDHDGRFVPGTRSRRSSPAGS